MAGSMLVVLFMLAVPTASLVTKPNLGCKKVSLLHRGDPADSKNIEGDDCGNVKTIIAKWAKSKKVGELNGKAQAAVMGANLAAKNTESAVKAAKALGEKVGLDGKLPSSVKDAAEVATKAAGAATDAATSLDTTSDTFKGKFDDFAKAISSDDIAKIKEETEKANVAAEDAVEAAARALKKADEAKDEAMKNSKGALKLIDSSLDETAKLSKLVTDVSQKSEHASKDVAALIKKSKAAATKLDDKAKDAKEQAPVWKAYKSDLEGRESAADQSVKDVADAIKDVDTANTDMKTKAKVLSDVKDQAQADSNSALGQTENLANAEESIRKTESELENLKRKVVTMMKDSGRLEDKIKAANTRLAK